nr:Ig-like domain-containing protein [Clostridium botulinum]
MDNSNTYDRGISIFLGDNNIGFRVNDFRSSAGINIKDNKWHDVMLTWDGTTNNNGVKFYLDNLKKPVKSGKVSTINGAIENLAFGDIGSWDSDRYKFKGDLDDIEIYDEVVDYSSKAESISLDKTSMDLIEGSSDNLNAKVLPEDATNKKVVWSSSDEKIAKVDENGKVTAIKEGQVTITAKVEGTDLTATCKVNVTKKVEENKNNAILSISLVNGATKEYDVSMQEVEKFINWFEERSNGKGPSLYSFDKKINPYKTVKEYIVHDKIASFEVREYEGTNK